MILDQINKVRKIIMPKLTQNIGKSHFKKVKKDGKNAKINNILLCRPNQRLGNMLLVTPLLQELIAEFPNCKIDIIVKGAVANQVFKEYKNIQNIIILPRRPFGEPINYLKVFFSIKNKRYDLVINGDKGSSSGKILTYLSNAKYKIYGTLEDEFDPLKETENEHMAKNSVYYFRYYLNQIGYPISAREMPDLDLKLDKNEILKGKETLDKSVVHLNKKTISIFTYATGSKCYSKEWWSEFYEKLKTSFGDDYNILEILPVENVSQIDFKASSFYSKDIREIASVIANTEIFIGADSGIMHLASASRTTTIGLFSVTVAKKYEPYNGKSISIDTNNTTIDDSIKMIDAILKNE